MPDCHTACGRTRAWRTGQDFWWLWSRQEGEDETRRWSTTSEAAVGQLRVGGGRARIEGIDNDEGMLLTWLQASSGNRQRVANRKGSRFLRLVSEKSLARASLGVRNSADRRREQRAWVKQQNPRSAHSQKAYSRSYGVGAYFQSRIEDFWDGWSPLRMAFGWVVASHVLVRQAADAAERARPLTSKRHHTPKARLIGNAWPKWTVRYVP